jgi:hypothetical protein
MTLTAWGDGIHDSAFGIASDDGVLPAAVRSGFRPGVIGAEGRRQGSRVGSPAVSDN